MAEIKYKIKKDKELKGKRYETYSVEKIITRESGEIEHLYRTLCTEIDGEIGKINLDKVYFPKIITQKEWSLLSEEYHKAWINGTMTEKLYKELEELRLEEGVG